MTPLPTTSSSAAPMEGFCLVMACPGVAGWGGVVIALGESVALRPGWRVDRAGEMTLP